MPTLRRHSGTRVTGAPSNSTSPRSGATKPPMIRSRVVLPDPDGPSRLVSRPAGKAALTASSTRAAP